MEMFLQSVVWRFLKWLPAFALRRAFSEKWMAEHVDVDIRARHSPVEVVVSECPKARVNIVIRNKSHFRLEIDRVLLGLTYGAELANLHHFRREVLGPGEEKHLLLSAFIDSLRLEKLPFHHEHNSHHCHIDVLIECDSRIRKFRLEKTLHGIKPEITNINWIKERFTRPESA